MSNKKNTRLKGTIDTRNEKIEVSLSVILFKEDDNVIAYCPALNVYGYGMTETEAKKSFETSLSEFFKYTLFVALNIINLPPSVSMKPSLIFHGLSVWSLS